MANNSQDWDELGRNIQDIVDQAIKSQDYQKLNQTITQTVNRAVNMGSEAVRRAVDGVTRSQYVPANAVHREEKRPEVRETAQLPALYGKTNGKTLKGIAQAVGGIPVSFFSLVVFLVTVFTGNLATAGGIAALLFLAGGVWLTYSGFNTIAMVKRFKSYRKTLGQKTHCSLEKLSQAVGKNVKYVRRELRKMIDEGLFLEGHLDKEESCLITSDETYQYYEQSRLQLEERQRLETAAAAAAEKAAARRDPQVQEVLDRGDAFIERLHQCNEAIPGEEISEKISRIELIVQRIFDRAEARPEIIPDLKKLMEYYLPMTVKLLNAYADMDAQPVQGGTIASAKREIEATLDTLNLAFEKLLDDLFADTAMDVSSDISVLNTLLAQEGLTEDDLSKMKKQQS